MTLFLMKRGWIMKNRLTMEVDDELLKIEMFVYAFGRTSLLVIFGLVNAFFSPEISSQCPTLDTRIYTTQDTETHATTGKPSQTRSLNASSPFLIFLYFFL